MCYFIKVAMKMINKDCTCDLRILNEKTLFLKDMCTNDFFKNIKMFLMFLITYSDNIYTQLLLAE